MRNKLVALAIGEIGYSNRKEVIQRNEEMKLVEGEKLTQIELEVAFAESTQGRSDLLPERYPEMNGIIETEKSENYWGELWSIVKPMIESDSPKWADADTSGVHREWRKL